MKFAVGSIIAATASAVGKTFIIGAIGYISVKLPKNRPFLPYSSINMLSRFSFNVLLLPLIYTGIAASVTLESLASLWLVLVASFVIICLSFLVASILAYLPFLRVHEEEHFDALRVAVSFPNIVAIPILMFPALCEYEVFHEYGDIELSSVEENIAACELETNSVVFTYFFGFSLLFWTIGDRMLRNIAERHYNATNDNNENTILDTVEETESFPGETERNTSLSLKNVVYKTVSYLGEIIKGISPRFIILVLAFITACITPLQEALFEPGGYLRVIGSAMESLSSAGATVATIIVGGALANADLNEMRPVYLVEENQQEEEVQGLTCHDVEIGSQGESLQALETKAGFNKIDQDNEKNEEEASNYDKDENSSNKSQRTDEVKILDEVGQNTSSSMRASIISRQVSLIRSRLLNTSYRIIQHPSFKVQIWHVTSRLFVTPALVYTILLNLNCSQITPIAKLILLVNSSLPGALIVVVILKAQGLTDAASIVSQTYLPSYILSVMTTAAWASIGMITFDTCSGSR